METTQVLKTVPCTRKERKEAEELEKLRRFGEKLGRRFHRAPAIEEDDELVHNGYTICGEGSSKDEADPADEQPHRTTRFVYGQQAKDEPEEKTKTASTDKEDHAKDRKMVYATLAVIVVVAVVVWLIGDAYRNGRMGNQEPTAPSPAVITAGGGDDMVDAANDLLAANGWEEDEYVLGSNTDPETDYSSAGDGAFSDDEIQSVSGLISFMNSGERGAEALIAAVIAGSGGTRQEVLDSGNWIEVQSLIDFTYPGNTSFSGGKVINVGPRSGSAGDIFMIFVSPSTLKAVAVRGACANAQVYIPTPTDDGDDEDDGDDDSKSSDPADYKQPGDGSERDSGTGTRPPSTITTPAEVTPPVVETEVVGGGGVVDTPTNDPGSESGVTAPGATEPTEEPVPEPEEGVNPDDGSANTGDPGLPTGF